MSTLQLIKGKQQEISLHEKIAQLIARLSEHNKKHCLELIMALEAEERVLFLNAFMMAVTTLPDTAAAAA
ncbi:hypothetical protein LVJ82_02240 [Vitreoscilla massiliensis]|uniref:Uncharacterized protein n=1 Tax=Vitreoscilla massiliensis TaxID=1689272 RepID=A0ABY4E218_9NEIS|nr:hypothetical protein [Vitreoscilla massiliensis]UOO89831.1 hypothetical protein LVJ82_02240 [Vitreoscilla massiliensis]